MALVTLPGILRRLLEHVNTPAAHGLAAGREFSISGGATAAPVSFDGTGDVNLVVTSLDMSRMTTTGALPPMLGGTGRTDGKAEAWSEPRTFTLTGAVKGETSFDGSQDIVMAVSLNSALAPRPQAAAGVGQWVKFTTTLPAGGTWAWMAVAVGGYEDSGGVAGIATGAGVSAGGTKPSVPVPGWSSSVTGMAWRIA